jgi:hypothetical protein
MYYPLSTRHEIQHFANIKKRYEKTADTGRYAFAERQIV